MPNYCPKDRELMRALGSRGGVKSGEIRRAHADTRRMETFYSVWKVCHRAGCTDEEIAESMRPLDFSSGAHGTDWKCPECGHFTSNKRHSCAKCGQFPKRERLTRAELKSREAEHRIQAILAKHLTLLA